MASSSTRRIKIILATSLTVLGLTAAFLALVMFAEEGVLYDSSPDEVRPWTSTYDRTFSPPTPSARPSLVHHPLNPLDRTTNSDSVVFEGTRLIDQDWDYLPPKWIKPTPNREIPLADGSVLPLVAMVVSYPTGPDSFESGFFDPKTLEPMSEEAFKKLGRNPNRRLFTPDQDDNDLPMLYFFWDFPEVDRRFHNLRGTEHFDTRTHVHLNGNSYYGTGSNGLYGSGMTIYRWHDGPFTSVIGFVDGLWEGGKLPIKLGETLTLSKSGYEARICQIESVKALSGGASWGADTKGGRQVPYIRLNSNSPKDAEPETVIFLSVHPPEYETSIRYSGVTTSGEVLSSTQRTMDGELLVLHFETPLENLQEIEVELSTPEKRVAFEFAKFPGMPEANQGVTNLFAIEIPYLAPDPARYFDMEEFIRRSAQVRFHHTAQPPTTRALISKFTYDHRDASLAEILYEYQMTIGGPKYLRTNADFELHNEPSWYERWWDQIRSRIP